MRNYISKKIRIAALLTALFILFSGCAKIKEFAEKFKFPKKLPTETIFLETGLGKFEIKAEIADSAEERRQGYMFRRKISENDGMLFKFEDEAIRKFWMRGMNFSLDILFLDKNLEINGIIENAEPCEKDPCKTFDSPEPAKYVLELKEGSVKEKKIEIGDRILLEK